MTDLTGKVAVITGAGSGIGRATAIRFAKAGARVGITDVNADTLAETAALLPDGTVVTAAGDVTDPATVDELTTVTVDRFGRVDVLFNNVGTQVRKSLLDTTIAEFDRTMHVNCLSYLLAMQRIVPEMRKAGGGSVINVASVGALVALPNVGVYCASKTAVIGLTRSAAAEFAPDIRVNVICPGGVSTPLSAAHLDSFEDKEAALALLTGRQLIKRFADPEEIANVVAFLASDESSFMTGAVVPVDAGHTTT
jgi:NAD(P)-dependent dehydrogenase (short-subunit alcohol dehydrogenase family)